jgi:hypothetical protein
LVSKASVLKRQKVFIPERINNPPQKIVVCKTDGIFSSVF